MHAPNMRHRLAKMLQRLANMLHGSAQNGTEIAFFDPGSLWQPCPPPRPYGHTAIQPFGHTAIRLYGHTAMQLYGYTATWLYARKI